MEYYKYSLQKYKPGSKCACPQCHTPKSFVRYVDNEGQICFPEYVGRCDREDKCGYHYIPSEYFNDHPQEKNNLFDKNFHPIPSVKPVIVEPSFIDENIMLASRKCFNQNNLYIFLSNRFGEKEAMRLFDLYKVGTSKYWEGSTVFWQIDKQGNIRAGKIFLYKKKNGHRVKEGGTKINWVHTIMKFSDYHLKQCLFGEHLLFLYSMMPVGVVESEKTALIAAHYMPDFVWVATGGKNGCFNQNTMQVLKDREVLLVPDLQATAQWEEKAHLLKGICKSVKVCQILEKAATPKQREEGLDLADFFLSEDSDENVLAAMILRNSSLKLLIDTFGLELISVERN